MKNISINKTLTTIIFLIKGAFPVDRHKKKKRCILYPKNKQPAQIKNDNKKSQNNYSFPFQVSQSDMRALIDNNII